MCRILVKSWTAAGKQTRDFYWQRLLWRVEARSREEGPETQRIIFVEDTWRVGTN